MCEESRGMNRTLFVCGLGSPASGVAARARLACARRVGSTLSRPLAIPRNWIQEVFDCIPISATQHGAPSIVWALAHQMEILMKADLRKLMVIAILVIPSSGAHAQAATVRGVRILEQGIYEAETDRSRQPPNGVWPVYNVRLSRATTNIPMRRHLRFGLRYVLQGAPHGEPAAVELVTRYPAPGILDPRTQLWRTESRYQLKVRIGIPRYREFQFVEDDELVPGMWVFEFWQGARKLGEQPFCVGINAITRHAEKDHEPCHATIS